MQRRVFETEAFFSFHHANAYELDSAGGAPQVVVDTVAYPKGFDFSASMITGAKYYESDVGRGVLTRVVLDLQVGGWQLHRELCTRRLPPRATDMRSCRRDCPCRRAPPRSIS